MREGVGEFPAEIVKYLWLAVYLGSTPVDIVQAAHVVKPAHMVFVVVCDEDSIQMTDAGAQHLAAEIRSAVNKNVQSAILEKCR